MNEKPDHCTSSADRDTMRDEYYFSNAKRGVTAGRYAEGANVVVIDPEVLDVSQTETPSMKPFGPWRR